MDPISSTSMVFGAVLLLVSWLQLMIYAFREDYTWGLTSVFLPPLSYLYAFSAGKQAREPLILAGIGLVLLVFAFS